MDRPLQVRRTLGLALALSALSGCAGASNGADGNNPDVPMVPSDATGDLPATDVQSQDGSATDASDVVAVDSATADIVRTDAMVGPSCTGIHAPPAGLTRQTFFTLADSQLWGSSNTEWPRGARLDLTTWNPIPMGQLTSDGVNRPTLGFFGRNPSDTSTIEINTGSYVAFRIETTGLGARTGQLTADSPGNRGAPYYLTISECPGDLHPENPNCRSEVSGLAALGWRIGPGAASYCPMTEGTTYYLNAVFADPATPTMSTCPFSNCWWLVGNNCQTGC